MKPGIAISPHVYEKQFKDRLVGIDTFSELYSTKLLGA